MATVSPGRRACAAVWFAGVGFLASALLFMHPPMKWSVVYLYLLLPAISAGISGYLWGGAILDSQQAGSLADALLRGLGVIAASFVIFAGLFAVVYSLTEKSFPIPQVFRLFLVTLGLGALLLGPVVLVVGTLGTIALYALGRRIFSHTDGRA